MPQSMMGSVSGLSMASRGSRMSVARSVASVATLTTTMEKKTGLRLPILEYAGFTDVQRGSVLSALYTTVEGLFLIVVGLFVMINDKFSADRWRVEVRNSLVLFAAVTAVSGLLFLVASALLMQGLRRHVTYMSSGNMYAWLVVHSFYHELCEVTRLEDVARTKVSV
ncbi:uncharacterized protein LOC125179464 [Hyalella azteca]|uniref:Uncharacterized protein LOC125179464 n=1 Tax=Hyalella azteca TaxID=294128 RepID=A0A979FXQ3_HYAAZ|nr:uncharacterized protein LOC125179464 [Hyalella azteca]